MTSVPPKGDSDKKIGAGFAPLQVAAQPDPNMTVAIRAGSFWTADGVYVEYGGGNSPTIAVPGSQARFSLVCLTTAGSIAVTNGTIAASPNIPAPPAGQIPLAACYVTSTTTKLTQNQVFDVRPYLQTTDSAAIQAAIADRPTFTDMNNGLATKANLTGTPSNTWTINQGNADQTSEFIVDRSIGNDVSIRWDETLDVWTFTNDGVSWNPIAASSGLFIPLVPAAVTGNLATWVNGTGVVVDSPAAAATAVQAIIGVTSINALSDVNTAGAVIGEWLVWNGVNWVPAALVPPHTHVKADITDFVESDYVHTTGNETAAGNKTFTGNVTVQTPGAFVAQGAMSTWDDFVALRSNPANVTNADSGLTVPRPDPIAGFFPLQAALMYWDESSSSWVCGVTGNVGSIVTDGALLGYVLKAGDTMTGALVHPAGTAAAPSITFTSDLTKGVYDSGAGRVSVAIAGAEKVRFDASGVTVFSGFVQGGAGGMALWNAAAPTTGVSFVTPGVVTIFAAGVPVATFGGPSGPTSALVQSDIGVTVEGYDATILKSANIGTTVQAWDADLDAVSIMAAGSGFVQRAAGVWSAAALTAGQVNTALGYTAANAATVFLKDGSVAATGSFDLAGFSVNNVGTVLGPNNDPLSLLSQSPVLGDGNPVVVTAADGVGVTQNGGSVTIDAGASAGTGNGGSVTLTAGTSTGGTDGNVTVVAGQVGGTGAHFKVETNGLERLRIGSQGAWNLNTGGSGLTGQMIVSNGSGAAPAWKSLAEVPTPVTTQAVPYAVATDVEVVLATGTGNVSLPAPASGRRVAVKNVTAGSVTVVPFAADLIDGAASWALAAQWDSVTVVSDGTNWFVL